MFVPLVNNNAREIEIMFFFLQLGSKAMKFIHLKHCQLRKNLPNEKITFCTPTLSRNEFSLAAFTLCPLTNCRQTKLTQRRKLSSDVGQYALEKLAK